MFDRESHRVAVRSHMMPTLQLFAHPRQRVGGSGGGGVRLDIMERINTHTDYESSKFRGVCAVSCCLSCLLIDPLLSGPLDRSQGFNGTTGIEVSPHQRVFFFFTDRPLFSLPQLIGSLSALLRCSSTCLALLLSSSSQQLEEDESSFIFIPG